MTAHRGGSAFTRQRLAWIEAALADPVLKPASKVVAADLGLRWVNRGIFDQTGELRAWPSVARLMGETSLSEEGVLGALRQLCGRLAPREARSGLAAATPYLERVSVDRLGSEIRTRTNCYRLIPRVAPPRVRTTQKSRVHLGARVQAGEVVDELEVTPNDFGSRTPNSEGVAHPEMLGRLPLRDTSDLNPSVGRRARG